jgi:hypothetical protein
MCLDMLNFVIMILMVSIDLNNMIELKYVLLNIFLKFLLIILIKLLNVFTIIFNIFAIIFYILKKIKNI